MSTSEVMVTSKTVDLSNCDREQIQYAGAIQPHGAMLVLKEPGFEIIQASRNTAELFGVPAEKLLNAGLETLFDAKLAERLRARFLTETLEGAPTHLALTKIAGREFDVLAHRCDQSLILELEARPEDVNTALPDLYSSLSSAMSRLEATPNLQAFLDLAAQQVRAFTGFDRVMIYKFMEDGSGWVRSEALATGLEPYLGLHYPPSDIPQPARRLFSLTWVRHQPDMQYIPVPMVPEFSPVTNRPLDMSYAFLRSVSIMYVDYLKNMGTRASLVLTLLKAGKLWGLIACHHHAGPRHLPHEVRVACEFLAHMTSELMSGKEDLENHAYRMMLKSTEVAMLENISRRPDIVSGFTLDTPNLLQFVTAQGAAVVNGKTSPMGATPSDTEIDRVVSWLSTFMLDDVFATDCLSALLPEAAAFKASCCGLLAMRFSRTKDDFLLWFRPEIISTVDWAGDPNKPVEISGNGRRLSPRGSFALWKETVQLKSSPWSQVEVEAARGLRAAVLELVLRRAEDLGRLYADLERSHAELDSFAYVAAHDLKEPLRGIRNISEMLREDYADNLDTAGIAKLASLTRLSQRMEDLLNALLEYSRVGADEFSKSELDLNLIVGDALDLLQSRIQLADVAIKIPRPLPFCKADRIRLQEVFTNLISNAIKYNDKSVKEVEIGFEASPLGGPPVIYVRDNGIGITEAAHKDIFKIFRRLHPRDAFGGGSGAGLTIAAKIIDRLGGRIWLKSSPGLGTTFYFTLGVNSVPGVKA